MAVRGGHVQDSILVVVANVDQRCCTMTLDKGLYIVEVAISAAEEQLVSVVFRNVCHGGGGGQVQRSKIAITHLSHPTRQQVPRYRRLFQRCNSAQRADRASITNEVAQMPAGGHIGLHGNHLAFICISSRQHRAIERFVPPRSRRT